MDQLDVAQSRVRQLIMDALDGMAQQSEQHTKTRSLNAALRKRTNPMLLP